MISLRDYQSVMLEEIRSAFRAGHRRVLLAAATGSGKTRLFSYIAHGAFQKGMRVLAIVHRVEIIDQISETFALAEVPHVVLARGAKVVPSQVTVAAIQTLARREFDPPDFIIVDECQHLCSSTYTKTLERWPNAKQLSVTATPARLSGEPLKPWADILIQGPPVSWLIAQGYLAKPRYWAPPGPSMDGVRRVRGDFDQAEIEKRMTPKITGDAIAEYRKHSDGATAVVFCVTVRHACEVAEAFTLAGYPAECLHGELTREARSAMVARFKEGTTRVLTSVDVVSEGFDLPACKTAILMRPTQSLSMAMQQVGRVLRPKPDGGCAVILDMAGNLERHGPAEAMREWSLEGNVQKRSKVQPLSRCPTCFYMGPPFDACPECGAVRDAKPRVLKMGRGELEEWVPNTPGEQAVREMELARRDAQQRNILMATFKANGIPHERALAIAEAVVRKQRMKRGIA